MRGAWSDSVTRGLNRELLGLAIDRCLLLTGGPWKLAAPAMSGPLAAEANLDRRARGTENRYR